MMFCIEVYIPLTKIWYEQLRVLGYTNHFIVALDAATYHAFKHDLSQDYRVLNASAYRALESAVRCGFAEKIGNQHSHNSEYVA